MNELILYRANSRQAQLAEAVLWAGAGLVMLASHVGLAAWLMRAEPIVAADNAPPAAIMIEFSDVSEAITTDETDIAEEQLDTEASAPSEELISPEETEDFSDDADEPVVDEIEDAVEDIVELPESQVPLPMARPSQSDTRQDVVREQQKPNPQKRQKPRPQQQQAASQTARQAKAQVQQSNRNAGQQTSSGVSAASAARWQSRLMAHLERRKRYPAAARHRGERGIVMVRFSIDERGNVLSVSLARSSGFNDLDNEVLSLVHRASPVPAPPAGANRTITAPVRFNVQ